MGRIMMLKAGCPAIHQLGDLGRNEDSEINVHSETETHYIGNFEEGYGFVNVKFKKEDVRPLTQEEINEVNGKYFAVNNNVYFKIQLDSDGYQIKEEKGE